MGKTNWKKVKRLTEAEIKVAAESDPDTKLLTDAELKQFKRVQPPEQINVTLIRKKLHLSQEKFSDYFGISMRTVQEWEQGRRFPEGPARILLKVIEREPEAVRRALLDDKNHQSDHQQM